MLIYKKAIVLFFACLFFVGCTNKKAGKNEYLKYVENESNGLKVSKKIADVEYILQYKPIDFIRQKEDNNGQEKTEDLKGMQYYTLSYSLAGSNKDVLKYDLHDESEYYERTNYFSYGFQDDIYLVDGNDTLQCKLFNYVRSYGLSPEADFVLAFNINKKNTMEDKQLVIDDKIFNAGIVKLKIAKKDLENIPELIEK